MMGEGFGHGLGGGLWGALIWLVPILLLAWGAFALFGARGGSRGEATDRRTPREVLDEEYARGRIDREEYLQRKEDLSG